MVEITYYQEGDFFVPDLYLENEDYENDYIIGKYGNLRLKYLKNHKKAEYIIMFMNKTLRKHIVETDKQAKQRFEILMKQIIFSFSIFVRFFQKMLYFFRFLVYN